MAVAHERLATGKSGQAGPGANADQSKLAQAASSEGNQQTLQNEMSLSGQESSHQASTKKPNRRQAKNPAECSKIQPKGKLEPSGLSEVTCTYSDPLSYHCSKLCNFERLPLNS